MSTTTGHSGIPEMGRRRMMRRATGHGRFLKATTGMTAVTPRTTGAGEIPEIAGPTSTSVPNTADGAATIRAIVP